MLRNTFILNPQTRSDVARQCAEGQQPGLAAAAYLVPSPAGYADLPRACRQTLIVTVLTLSEWLLVLMAQKAWSSLVLSSPSCTPEFL